MNLQCYICKHKPFDGERYIEVESWAKVEGGSIQGINIMVCAKHLSAEIIDALELYAPSFVAFGQSKKGGR